MFFSWFSPDNHQFPWFYVPWFFLEQNPQPARLKALFTQEIWHQFQDLVTVWVPIGSHRIQWSDLLFCWWGFTISKCWSSELHVVLLWKLSCFDEIQGLLFTSPIIPHNFFGYAFLILVQSLLVVGWITILVGQTSRCSLLQLLFLWNSLPFFVDQTMSRKPLFAEWNHPPNPACGVAACGFTKTKATFSWHTEKYWLEIFKKSTGRLLS